MDKIKRKKIELAGAHRACEFYGLNEGIDNHITTKDMIHMGFYVVWWLTSWCHQNHCKLESIFNVEKDGTTFFQKFKVFGFLSNQIRNQPIVIFEQMWTVSKSKSEYVKDLDVILMIQFGVYWSDVTVDHVLEIDPKTYCIVQRNLFEKTPST